MKLGCVNISTTNVDEMRDFYSLVLNTPYDDFLAPDRYEIKLGDVGIIICRASTPTVINPENCGLEFAVEDVDAEYDRLVKLGIKPDNSPVTLPWNYRYFSVKDPDGNNLDFVQNLNE